MDVQPLASVFVLALLGFSSFYFLPPTIGKVQPDAAATTTTNQALAPMTSPQTFSTFASCFQNQCTGTIKYVFKPSGFAYWHNTGSGNITLTGFAVGGVSRSVTASSNSTTIDYHIAVPNVVTMDVYFKETPTNGRPSNTFKVTMIGTSSVSGTFTWNFGNSQSFPVTCDNTKHILTYGTAGLNFTDATNFSATCTTTSVSFTIGVGAFRIDPTTITTSTVTGTSALGLNWSGLTWIANSRFWIFFSDGTNVVWVTSTNGATWSAKSTFIPSVTTIYFVTIWIDSSNNICYNRSVNPAVTTFFTRCGTANSDGTITWGFAERTITITNKSSIPTPSITEDTNNNLYVGINALIGTTYYIQVERCAGGSANWGTCTWTNILNRTSSTAARQEIILRPVSSGNLILIDGSDTGASSFKFISCASPCSSSSNWGSTVTSSQTNLDIFFSDFVNVGSSIYGGIYQETGTVQFTTFPYNGNSCCTLTQLASVSGLNGVNIGTNTNQQLIITYTDASTVNYFLSTNLGSTWMSNVIYVSGETSIKIISQLSLYGLNNYYAENWLAGAASPFNLRFQSLIVNIPYPIIQSTSCTGTGSTVNCAFASNTKAGSSLVVFAGSTATTTVSTVTDTQSLTYSQIVGSDVGTVGDSEAWWACHPSTAAADTVTVSYSLSVTATIILYELHGRPTGTSCGPSSSTGSSASSSTAAVGSYTPRANAFIIGALDSSCQVACTITAGSGYSLDFNVAINAVNDFTTEYFWNVATADTTPYTFSVASAYNEISVTFYDLVWTNSTATDTSTVTDSPARGLSLPRAPSDTFTFVDVVTKGLFKTVSDTFTFADSGINSVIGGAIVASRQTTGAILVFGIIIVFTLIAFLVFGRRR